MAGGFSRSDGGDLILAIRLTPKAAKDGIGGIWQDEKGASWLQARVRAVPEKGRANAALIRLIARRLALPANSVSLESGDTSRLKKVRISGGATDAVRISKELDER